MLQLEKSAGPTVKVFTAGDHFAGYEEPADVKEPIEALLIRAGYTKELEWEARVDKKCHCDTKTRPIRISGCKQYGIMMRVKSSQNANYDFQVTLYVPSGSGYSVKNLFDQLKANEKSVSRIIRQQEKKPVQVHTPPNHATVTPVITPTPPAIVVVAPPVVAPVPVAPVLTEYRPTFTNLQRVVKDFDKLSYVLDKIAKVQDTHFCNNRQQFVNAVRHECKWDKEAHALVAVGRVFSELVKNDYIMEVVTDRDQIKGYALTEKGDSFIKNYVPSGNPPKAPTPKPAFKPESKVNFPELLSGMRDKLRELADVASKIAVNNDQRRQLQSQMEVIDKENEELSKIITQNKDCYEVLSRLGQVIVPLPMLKEVKNV
jgi:DNA-binding PadR family transcriptional regulator